MRARELNRALAHPGAPSRSPGAIAFGPRPSRSGRGGPARRSVRVVTTVYCSRPPASSLCTRELGCDPARRAGLEQLRAVRSGTPAAIWTINGSVTHGVLERPGPRKAVDEVPEVVLSAGGDRRRQRSVRVRPDEGHAVEDHASFPVLTYSRRLSAAVACPLAQYGHCRSAYSTSVNGALGEPRAVPCCGIPAKSDGDGRPRWRQHPGGLVVGADRPRRSVAATFFIERPRNATWGCEIS